MMDMIIPRNAAMKPRKIRMIPQRVTLMSQANRIRRGSDISFQFSVFEKGSSGVNSLEGDGCVVG
jgi:hypothetical protein